ncbi:hypothetical protein MYFR107205_30870 [Mycolicibacterium frederiksbergense]
MQAERRLSGYGAAGAAGLGTWTGIGGSKGMLIYVVVIAGA